MHLQKSLRQYCLYYYLLLHIRVYWRIYPVKLQRIDMHPVVIKKCGDVYTQKFNIFCAGVITSSH